MRDFEDVGADIVKGAVVIIIVFGAVWVCTWISFQSIVLFKELWAVL